MESTNNEENNTFIETRLIRTESSRSRVVASLKKYWPSFLLSQAVSVFIFGTGVVNTQLSDSYSINIPTTQSVLNYILLALIFIPVWLLKRDDNRSARFKSTWWKYLLVSVADVEGNYFMVKAYSLTIVTTIQVIDAFILPIAVILSYLLLKHSYRINHVISVVGCLLGCGLIIYADSISNGVQIEERKLVGDLFCLLGSVFYAISNVGAEFFVRDGSKREYWAMLSLFGSLISICQMMIFERDEISNLFLLNNLVVWMLFVVESLFMFFVYVFIPIAIEFSSAAFLNVNLLTSDFYTALYGVIVKKQKFHECYVIGFVLITLCTIIYSLREPIDKRTRRQEDDEEANQTTA